MLGTARLLLSMRGRSRLAPAALAELQTRALRSLVGDAYARVPLHRRRLDAARVRPEEIRTLADVARVPTMPKALLRETPIAELIASGVDPSACDEVRTSGSTGMPLRVLRGPAEVAWHRAAGLRIFRELGFRWTDRTFEVRATLGPTFAVQRLGVAPKRWMSILEPIEAQVRALLAYRPQVVFASASTLHDLAAALIAAGEPPPPVRLVIADAESLLPATRALVTRAFGRAPYDVYGLVELSNFAWECERHDGLHVSADTHLVEILDAEGRPVPPGTPGRIVCTDLVARTMPMLRYETGDAGALMLDPCPCGRTFPRLVELVGRDGDVIRLPDGRRLHWPYFHETFARLDDLERWQVIQETAGRVRVRVLARAEAYAALAARLRASLAAVLPPSFGVDVEPWGSDADDPTRKHRPVVSRLADA
jgi:phenylacetate-CoA ligase